MTRSVAALMTVVAVTHFTTPDAAGRMDIQDQIDWPEYWPAELATIRADKKTYNVHTGTQETVYELTFRTREDFKKAWPLLVNLATPHAPITVHAAQPVEDPNRWMQKNGPIVRVYSCTRGARIVNKELINLPTAPPYPEDIVGPDGSLPEYVEVEEIDGELKAIPLESDELPRGFCYRCRVEIEVIADERLIFKDDIRRMPGNGVFIDADAPAPTPTPDELQLRWELPGRSNASDRQHQD